LIQTSLVEYEQNQIIETILRHKITHSAKNN